MTLIKAGKVSEIAAGEMRITQALRRRIALCNIEGRFYAIEDVCTHDDGPLGEGTLCGSEVECPRHGARFDVRTGAAARMPAVAPVRTYPVHIEADDILVEVS